ncbi:MAG TPA: S9 family peptidase [Candidatus Polarisedimenticolia bacterium]|nr:S9 family peptidase [Candidatus Polarisedimenticolia bacterium]
MRRTVGIVIPLAAALGAAMSLSANPATTPKGSPRLTLERVARFPPPGRRVASSFRFSPDGRFVYSLRPEGAGIARSLFREEVQGGRREVVARASTLSGGEERPTRQEELRRERRRIQDKGITQFVVADEADVVVFAWSGDLYLVRPGSEPLRLTESGSIESDPQLSPDGARLAFVRDGDLYVLDLATRLERRLTSGARDGVTHGVAEYIAQEEMDRATGFWWSPDGSRLAYTEVDETGIPIYPIVHQGTAAWEVEPSRYPFAGGPNAHLRLGIIPARGGETLWLGLAPEGEDFYLARVRWDRGGALLAQVEARDQKSLRLVRFDPASGAAKTLLEERARGWINLHDDLRPLRDGRFLWSSESSGFRHLELRGPDGSLVRRLTSGDWPVDRLEGVDEPGGSVYFTAGREGPLQRQLYRVSLDGGTIERLTPEDGFHEITLSPDGRLLVDLAESAAAPPRALLKDGDGRLLRVLDPNDDEEVRALSPRPPEFVTLRAADGSTLYGAIYKPRPLAPGRRAPALVWVYGGPTAQTVKDSWEMTENLRAQFLTDQGYVVFRLDNRGSPRRGKAFEETIARRLGSVEVEDQIAGARYLAGLPYVDGSRLGIYGWSYGGYMAVLCLLKAPDLFRAAVAGAPVSDWDGYDTHYTERYMGTPQENPEGYRAASLLPLASRLRGHLLILHGMVDENVHFRHTARLLNALNGAQKEYDLLIFPDERHLPRGEDDRRYLEERLVHHFARYVKGR